MTGVNALHWEATDPDVLWSGGNVSEAIPGVSTALNWSLVGDLFEVSARRGFASLGVLARNEIRIPTVAEERFIVVFYGRAVANIDMLRAAADRMPGTTANAVEAGLFGTLRPDAENHPTLTRVPAILTKAPVSILRLGRRQLDLHAHIARAWQAAAAAPPADLAAASALLDRARALYTDAFTYATVTTMLAQAVYDQIVELAGDQAHQLVTGYQGVFEAEMLRDLGALAREELSLATFLSEHGYHGPDEGQIAARVWREDPEPLLAIAARYADREPPAVAETRQRAVRKAAESELLAGLPPLRRPGARLLLRLGRQLIPRREIGKASYSRCLDMSRIAARVAGRELGVGDDVVHLTVDDVLSGRTADVEVNRALWEDYRTTELPDVWTGPPERLAPALAGRDGQSVVRGQGVGGGSVLGRVRVVHDPSEELADDEILVCRGTDPGWVPLMNMAAGIAIDLGGVMSHAAIVARELGLPCVTTTSNGTRVLRTGDLVELDGDVGTVTVLQRVEAAA
jgi:pyruvate,water dikinase